MYIHFGKLPVGVNLFSRSSRAKSFCGWTNWKLLKWLTYSSMIAHSSRTSSRASSSIWTQSTLNNIIRIHTAIYNKRLYIHPSINSLIIFQISAQVFDFLVSLTLCSIHYVTCNQHMNIHHVTIWLLWLSVFLATPSITNLLSKKI